MKSNIRVITVFALVFTIHFLVAPQPADGALPLTEITRMQEGAPEKVRIEVTSVKRTEKEAGGGFLFKYRVRAKVVAVERTGSDLKVGDEIHVRYSMPNFEKSPATGDWPSPVEGGAVYHAYLEMRNAEEKVYEPAAASGTFKRVAAGE